MGPHRYRTRTRLQKRTGHVQRSHRPALAAKAKNLPHETRARHDPRTNRSRTKHLPEYRPQPPRRSPPVRAGIHAGQGNLPPHLVDQKYFLKKGVHS